MGTLLGCEAACVVLSPLLLLTVVGGGGCGGVVCQLHSGREHLVSNFFVTDSSMFLVYVFIFECF